MGMPNFFAMNMNRRRYQTRMGLSVHEASHACAALYFARPVESVEITPDADGAGGRGACYLQRDGRPDVEALLCVVGSMAEADYFEAEVEPHRRHVNPPHPLCPDEVDFARFVGRIPGLAASSRPAVETAIRTFGAEVIRSRGVALQVAAVADQLFVHTRLGGGLVRDVAEWAHPLPTPRQVSERLSRLAVLVERAARPQAAPQRTQAGAPARPLTPRQGEAQRRARRQAGRASNATLATLTPSTSLERSSGLMRAMCPLFD
jgi:hypothetical protein